MTFDQGLEAELESIEGFNQKIFPNKVPDGTTLPYMVYRQIKGESLGTLQDPNAGYFQGTYQVDFYEDSYSALKADVLAVKNQLKTCLFENIGTDGPYIQNMMFLNELEKTDENADYYHGILQCKFAYDQ